MKNDIYIILNEADVNLENYEKEDFNDIEKKNIKAKFRKSIIRKKSYKKNIIAALATIALVVVILGTNVRVQASVLLKIKDIASFLRIERSLEEYETIVNKAITDKGITVKLNEVILDGNEMTVSCNITSDKKLNENESWNAFSDIYVNGIRVSRGAGGSSKNIDDYTTQSVLTYDLANEDFSGDLKIGILSSTVMINGEMKNGTWNFEFKTNGDQLKIDTKEMKLYNKFTLENGQEFVLEKYTDNALGQKIYASISNFQKKSTYDVELEGNDDLGNKVEFVATSIGEEGALLKIQNIYGNLNKNAKILYLTPYAAKYPEQSGKMDDDFKQVGETFTIDLSQLKR